MTSRPVIVVASRHQPLELVLAAYGVALGAQWLAAGRPAVPPLTALPDWAVPAWYAGMVVGGAAVLAGALLPASRYGAALLAERVGLHATGAAVSIFVVLLIDMTGWRQWSGALILALWAAGCAWRVIQINQTLRQLRNANERLG